MSSEIISKRHVYIDDRESKIYPFTRFERLPGETDLIDELFQPPECDSPEIILNALNDDCLREIFHKFQHFSSLYSIGNFCVRFNEIAKSVFTSKYEHEKINLSEFKSDKGIESFLNDFGRSIKSLVASHIDFHNSNSQSNVLRVINRCCRNLTKLDIHFNWMDMNEQTLIEINPLLSRLKCLSMTGDWSESLVSSADLISACRQLEMLDISSVVSTGFTLPKTQLPRLIKFSSYVPCTEQPMLEAFLSCNLRLEDVKKYFTFEMF